MNGLFAILPDAYRARWPLIGAVLWACARLWAEQAPQPLGYNVAVLDSDRGLPHSFVTALAQTPDGYLWIGTHNGLARYDGFRVAVIDPITNPEFKYYRLEHLFVDSQGTLWIAPLGRALLTLREGIFAETLSGGKSLPGVVQFLGHTSNAWFFVTSEGGLLRGLAGEKPDLEWQELDPIERRLTQYALSSHGEVLAFTDNLGLTRLKGNEFLAVAPATDLVGTRVTCLASGSRGQVWVGTSAGLACYTNGAVRLVEAGNAPKRSAVREIVAGQNGNVWVQSENRLQRFRNGSWQAETDNWSESIANRGRRVVSFVDREGGLWLGGNSRKLVTHVLPDGRVEQLTQQDGLPAGSATCFLQDSEDGLWIGFAYGGVARLTPRPFQVLGQAQGLTNSAILSVCLDDRGAVWMAPFQARGPIQWNQDRLHSYVTAKPKAVKTVQAVCPADGGGVWVADSSTGISAIVDGKVRRPFEGASSVRAQILHRDSEGRMWMACKDGLRMWDHGAMATLPQSLWPYPYRTITSDAEGTVWLGAEGGQVRAYRDGQCQTFVPDGPLARRPVWSLLAETNGVVWVGTMNGGLMRLQHGKFFRFTMAQGLPSDVICSILEDGFGNLWCGSDRGIFRIAKQVLHDFAAGELGYLSCASFGLSDGLPALECSGRSRPGAWRGPDGRLWFATRRGVVSVQPTDIEVNRLPPEVAIEEVWADGDLLASSVKSSGAPAVALIPRRRDASAADKQPIVIQPGKDRYEFRFTGISLRSPEDVRFRYRLEGFEKRWANVGRSRSAVYTGLSPGTYRFQVEAANRDGVYSNAAAEVLFRVLPRFYQTLWFRGIVVAAALAGISAIVFMVMRRRMKRELARLELQHAVERERTRIARDMHDELGASLTRAGKLVEMLGRNDGTTPAPRERLAALQDTLRNMLLTLDELVWVVNPRNDSLDGLANYIAAYAREFLSPTSLHCRLETPLETGDLVLNAQQRHHFFLTFKEALTNVVRHAQATEVAIELRLEANNLLLQVADNGRGLGAAQPGRGRRGLENMRKRMEAVGGTCTIADGSGKGTTVRLLLPMPVRAADIERRSPAAPGEPT